MSFRFDLDGLEDAIRGFERLRANFLDEIDKGTEEQIRGIFDVTQERVPKKTDALMRSGRVDKVGEAGHGKSEWKITYGDSDTENVGVYYAAAVHEVLDAEHPPPTGPKYVEGPLLESLDTAKPVLVKHARKAIDEAFRR